MLTRYGFIPDKELEIQNIPNTPEIKLPNYVIKLHNAEIDSCSSPIRPSFKSNLLRKALSSLVQDDRAHITNLLGKSTATINDWSSGRYNPPINAVFDICKEYEKLTGKSIWSRICKDINFYTCHNSPHLVKLPKTLNPKLAYFIGAILGDAGLKDTIRSKSVTGKYEHKIIIGDEFNIFTEQIARLFEDLFNIDTTIRLDRLAKGERFTYVNPTCKVLHRFLTQVFEVPEGKKTGRLRIPKLIKQAPLELKFSFLSGVMDTDGDVRAVESGKLLAPRIKLRMANEIFIIEIQEMFGELGINLAGPYKDKGQDSYYIQGSINAARKCAELNLFKHPVKSWRIERMIRGRSSRV